MSLWGNLYRRGRRPDLVKQIAGAKQLEFILEALREALKQETAVKRPRRWLVDALNARISVLVPRMEKIARVDVIAQLNYKGEQGPFTIAQTREFFEAATEFHQLVPDGTPPAPKVTEEEAFRWLDAQPDGARMYLYSTGRHLIYFGEWEAHAARRI